MEEPRAFRDPRFHIRVIPLVEHKLPLVARRVKEALYDEGSLNLAMESLEDLLPQKCETGEPPQEREAVEKYTKPRSELPTGLRSRLIEGVKTQELKPRPSELHAQLHARCISVCTHTEEYLRCLSHAWYGHLDKLRTERDRILKQIDLRVERIVQVHAKHRAKNPRLADAMLGREQGILCEDMERQLERSKTVEEPSVPRPEVLVEAAERLKLDFSTFYGKIPTEMLQGSKETFETNMRNIELDVASEFIRCAEGLLAT